MSDSGLAADNLFQLNVLIWGLFPLPPGAPVRPALRELGYKLRHVEYPLTAGVGELADLQAATPRIGPNPVADLVLEHADDHRYVLVECKSSSYGAESSTGEQGRALLVAGARVRARLGEATGTAEICFVVPASQAPDMDEAIVQMQQQVADAGQPTCAGGSVDVEIRSDGVYIGRDDEPAQGDLLPAVLRPMLRIVETQDGEDPRPLYVVPWTPGAARSADLSAFREKVRAELLSRLGRAGTPAALVMGFDEILDAVSHGIYLHWREKDSLYGQVFPELRAWLAALTLGDPAVSVSSKRVEVNIQSDTDLDRIMETVRSSVLPERTPRGYQPPMFESEEGR